MRSSLIETVACIYRSSMRPENAWSEALDRIAAEMGAKGAHLHLVDPQREEISIAGMSSMFPGPDSEVWTHWRESLVKSDLPGYRALMAQEQTGFHTDISLLGLTENQHRNLPSIKFNIERFNVRHRAATRLNLHGAWLDMLAVQYATERGPITPQESAVGDVIIPHMAKSVEMHRNFLMLQRRFDAVIAVLDRWHIGICIVLGDGSLLVANRQADEILDNKDGLIRDHRNRLVCLEAEENGVLQDALARATATASGSDDKAETQLALSRSSGLDAYLVSVAPLSDDGHELDRDFAGAFVAIIDPSRVSSISTSGMGEIYKLTKTEREICQLVAEGHKTDEIAEIRDLQLETVRSYVKSVLAKTRTHGRPDLVRLALLLNPPIEKP